jgi:hypothetical protein
LPYDVAQEEVQSVAEVAVSPSSPTRRSPKLLLRPWGSQRRVLQTALSKARSWR